MKSKVNFTIFHKSKKSNARLGLIKSPHGTIKTPAFVPCATKATLKSLTPTEIDELSIQLMFVNTYHMVISPGVDIIAATGGIHNFSKINKPLITDSGGFQVFSLGRRSHIQHDEGGLNERLPHLVKINDDGVRFRSHTDGAEYFFTPEFSIEAQKKIGADFMVAFDECLPAVATRKQTERSIARTHKWAKRSLQAFAGPVSSFPPQVLDESARLRGRPHESTPAHSQQLYGVIQGGVFEDLRQKSAKYIASLPFWGLAIGGVAVGETKRQMRDQVGWVMPMIQKDARPRHLLGVGDFDDIVDMVKMGVDTFDCVTPTRHARMGKLINDQKNGEIDIFKSKYKDDLKPIDEKCQCYTCQNFTRAYLHHLFKQRELLGYRLATLHNLFVMEKFMKRIREAIELDSL